ncbi:MAG: hypothetical protein ABR910_09355 [Acidobacteriaceae bacterium]
MVVGSLGLFSAASMSWLVCKITRSRTLTTPVIFLHSAEYVALAALAGAAAVFLNVKAAARPSDPSRNTISRTLAAGWVYVPCITILYWERSPWMLLTIALAALSTAFGLSRLFPHPAGPAPTHPADHPALPSLNGLPPADTPFDYALWTALCAQAFLICLIVNSPTLALLLFGVAVFLLAWRWSALDTAALNLWLGRRPPFAHAALAVLITAYALMWGNGSAGAPGYSTSAAAAPAAAPQRAAEDHDSSGYYGIILLPPPRKAVVVDPVLSPSTDSFGRMSKPVLIPFDGPYWYFKAPSNAPSTRAHIAHGNPIDVNIRSTNFEPLIMEAHQTLSEPIDLACCSQINLALTNGDTRSGEINVGLLLTDATAPSQPQLLLGVKPISSTQADQIPADRPPVNETLHFDIPASPSLHRFNQITVLFMPSHDRGRFGSKVTVQSFELIPRP